MTTTELIAGVSEYRRRWEYHLGSYEAPAPNIEKLNALGAEGWELVQVTPVAPIHGRIATCICLFKREARS